MNIIFDYESRKVDPARIELATLRCKRSVLPLDYGPYGMPFVAAVFKVVVNNLRCKGMHDFVMSINQF